MLIALELIVEVFENLKKGSLSQAVVETDYDHFFWAVSFFVGYNYHNEIKVHRTLDHGTNSAQKVTANSVAFDVGAVSGALGFPIFGFIFDKIKENGTCPLIFVLTLHKTYSDDTIKLSWASKLIAAWYL